MDSERMAESSSVWADVIRGIAACIIGMLIFLAADRMFHLRAPDFIEDVPGHTIPLFDELNLFFMTIPYAVGAVVVGLLAGAGRLTRLRFPLTRLAAGLGIYGLLNVAYTDYVHPSLVPLSLRQLLLGALAFLLCLLVDGLYRWHVSRTHAVVS